MHLILSSGHVGGEEMKKLVILVMLVAVLMGACETADTYTAGRTLGGGAIGAGSGALIGWAAGNPAAGAAIGGGAGLLGGYIYDQYQKSQGRP